MLSQRLSLGLLIFVITGSIVIALHAFGFQFRLSGDPGFHARFDTVPIGAAMHVLGGGLCLLLGGFQFSSRLRSRHLSLHRNMGRAYLMLVLIGGIGSLILAPRAEGGLVARFGFGLLALLWLFSALQAYLAIRRRDIETHRAWMLRNFALTFGAVTLRIYLGIFGAFGVEFDESYPTVAWISWVPNLILVEWYLALARQHEEQRTAKVTPG
jgi:uncharacterized membrane protein